MGAIYRVISLSKKKKAIIIIIIVILLSALITSVVYILLIMSDYRRDKQLYAEIRDEAVTIIYEEIENTVGTDSDTSSARIEEQVSGELPYYPEINVDFSLLYERNQEIIAWLWIPGTDISYPITQTEDNFKYLNRAYDDTPNRSGAIFLDYRNKADFTGKHSIIYGHNMRDGSMFGQLSLFDDQEYFDAHDIIYIITETAELRYRIFSHYITDTINEDSYQLGFSDDAQFRQYQSLLQSRSYQTADDVPEDCERLITLSTCYVSGTPTRRVLHAYLLDETQYSR